MFLLFASSWLFEYVFLKLTKSESEKREELLSIDDVIWVCLTSLEPCTSLIYSWKQAQPSHRKCQFSNIYSSNFVKLCCENILNFAVFRSVKKVGNLCSRHNQEKLLLMILMNASLSYLAKRRVRFAALLHQDRIAAVQKAIGTLLLTPRTHTPVCMP